MSKKDELNKSFNSIKKEDRKNDNSQKKEEKRLFNLL